MGIPACVFQFVALAQEEETDFYPCHERFGLLDYYPEPRLQGEGHVMLPHNIIA